MNEYLLHFICVRYIYMHFIRARYIYSSSSSSSSSSSIEYL